MKTTIEKATKGWKFIVGLLSVITLIFGSYQAFVSFRTPDISGEWYLNLKVDKSTYRAYIGDAIGIKAYFSQADKNVSGRGEKWEYRGKKLDYKQHHKLDFIGSINGTKFKSNYVLHGELRETTGFIDVEILDGGKIMKGTFTGTAADTKGTISGLKLE